MSKSVGERLAILRKKIDLNQEDFGEKIGLTKSAISKIEKGWTALTDKNIMLICRQYGVSESWLLKGEGPMFQDRSDAAKSLIRMLGIINPLDIKIIEAYLAIDEKYRAAFGEFLDRFVEELNR